MSTENYKDLSVVLVKDGVLKSTDFGTPPS